MQLFGKIWKTGIVTELLQAGDPAAIEIGRALERRIKRLFGRALAILRAKNIVTPRKVGSTVQYTLSDRLITKLLSVARDIFNNDLVDKQTMLRELQREARQ